ncbi:hypothetical protein AQUCO_00700300v1 [Aquilegia coerulea]|uniref:Uncharacterized protein n=1 Tax=Aquilegia coerulea TaxID=218851 RepID=A0A2G5EJV4_AQUCA|nr:hypothetical protein AQUCO_00700300v1 [Aquilegia coerulea]
MAATDQDKFRSPCPDRITDDLGGAFALGIGGGSIVHYIQGARRSEKGRRIIGGLQNARMYTPKTGGGFAVWGGVFSTCDCTMVYLRQKEDPLNSVISGALTGGLLQMRQGFLASGRSALLGGCILAMFEGVQLMVNRFEGQLKDKFQKQQADRQRAEQETLAFAGGGGNQLDKNLDVFLTPSPSIIEQTNSKVEGFSSRFGGLFGGRNQADKPGIEEIFDIPAPPMPNFDY